MKKIQVLAVVCFSAVILSGVEGFAQTARDTGKYSFSLQQAIDFAMKNQTQVKNADYDEQIAKEKVREIVGIGLPQVGGSLTTQDFIEIPTTLVPANAFIPTAPPDVYLPLKFGIQYSASAGVEVSQLVFSSDYLIGIQSTKSFLELSRKAGQRTRIETIAAVSKAYYSALLNDERMKLVEANITRLKKLSDDTQSLSNNGFVEKIDVDRITVSYNNLLVEKEKIQRMMTLGMLLLKFQLGMDQLAILTLTDKLADIQFQLPVEKEKFAYENRVEYSLMQSQRNISRLQLKGKRMAYLPTAALFGSASENAYSNKWTFFDAKQGWYPTVLIGARINIGVFDGLQTHHRIQQAKLELLKADNNLKMMQQSIDLEISSAKANLENAASSVNTQKKNIELAESIYTSAKVKYEHGVGSNLEVMNAETSLKEAQTNYFSALYDAIISKVDYDKANGNIK